MCWLFLGSIDSGIENLNEVAVAAHEQAYNFQFDDYQNGHVSTIKKGEFEWSKGKEMKIKFKVRLEKKHYNFQHVIAYRPFIHDS